MAVNFKKGTVKQGKAKITVKKGTDAQSEEKVEVVGDPKLYAEPPCNVGLSLGATLKIGEYNYFKADVSLHMPCLEEDIDKIYKEAKEWVDDRLGEIMDDMNKDDEIPF